MYRLAQVEQAAQSQTATLPQTAASQYLAQLSRSAAVRQIQVELSPLPVLPVLAIPS
jgi:hypothetical protein